MLKSNILIDIAAITFVTAHLRGKFSSSISFPYGKMVFKNFLSFQNFVEKKIAFYKADSKNSGPYKYKLNDAKSSVFKNILQNISKKKIISRYKHLFPNLILIVVLITMKLIQYLVRGGNIIILMKWCNSTTVFYDSHHLNQIGVTMFNYSIINILSKNKLVEK